MSDNRKVAEGILVEAIETIVKKRPGVHGSAENSFEMIGQLWGVYLTHKMKAHFGDDRYVNVSGVDVAQMMSMMKKARSVYGDPENADNFVDDVGYSALAAMLQLPDPDAKKQLEEHVNNVGVVSTPLANRIGISPDKEDN